MHITARLNIVQLNCTAVAVFLWPASIRQLKRTNEGMLSDPTSAKNLNTKRHLKLIQKFNIGLLIMAIFGLDLVLRCSGKLKTCIKLLSISYPSLQPTNTRSWFLVLLLVLLFVDCKSDVRERKEFFANLALRISGFSSPFTIFLRRLLCYDFASNLFRSIRKA